MSRWYRAYEGTVTDAKLAEAAMVAEVSRSVSIAAWHCLLESAATVNNCGSYETSARRVAITLCEPLERITALFAAYEEIGLVGKGAVLSWKKRQFTSDNSATRVAKHRARKRQETAECNDGNADETLHNAPETETETDKVTSVTSTVSNETVPDKPDLVSPEEFVEAYNVMADQTGLAKARLTPERRKKIIVLTRRRPMEEIREAIWAIPRSPFLCGDGPRGWRANIDFLFQPTSFQKLIEGSYEQQTA